MRAESLMLNVGLLFCHLSRLIPPVPGPFAAVGFHTTTNPESGKTYSRCRPNTQETDPLRDRAPFRAESTGLLLEERSRGRTQ